MSHVRRKLYQKEETSIRLQQELMMSPYFFFHFHSQFSYKLFLSPLLSDSRLNNIRAIVNAITRKFCLYIFSLLQFSVDLFKATFERVSLTIIFNNNPISRNKDIREIIFSTSTSHQKQVKYSH